MNTQEITKLAEKHGLRLKDEMSFNEMGIDFKVCFAEAMDGTAWVLRIPRRNDLGEQIEQEGKILKLAGEHLSVAVPDWKIANPELIAYPLLENKPVITYDARTYEVTWHMDQGNRQFIPALAKVLVELHQIPAQDAASLGIKTLSPEMARAEMFNRIKLVKQEVGVGAELENRWRKWLDNDRLWPDFTTFVHGDLYAGHILSTNEGKISGLIDWSEGQVNDPSMDFSGHVTVFGEDSLKELIAAYSHFGGKVWDHLFEQSLERSAATPLNYAYFAINTQSEEYLQAAKLQLGLG
ncbi:macrolide 2'-phosphotransferase [Pararhodonellum marinum]|uniref:macrolide 2'-phosphotransferase n=1 Tax=Pararhodonellum marinum TaxID=2755358 RepID=UPI0018903745|nr:macrolide 2'-phosphotransferase [Pararhodonellum marinum]